MTGDTPATSRPRQLIAAVALPLAAWLVAGTIAMAAPPDLTAGGEPGDSVSINLGPTGLRGWVYHVKADTSESRQIQVHQVDAGSPADGLLDVDDVILGANGSGAAPVNFSADARRSLASAIAAAEAQSPAVLKLIRWRAGATTTVDLTLATMGAYSATAPYNCPKSALILEDGLDYIMVQDEPDGPYDETVGEYSFGTLSLLAAGDPSDPDDPLINRAGSEVLELIPTATEMAQMMSDEQDTTRMITWQRGHALIVLAEYYLVTGDTEVLPAIEAYAVNIAKNQSLFGTVGHKYADKNLDGSNNGPMGGVYGVVNSAGMPCFLGVLLAKKCGLTNPELDPAIESSSRFFSYYCHRGAVPYGEHEAFWQAHENNGKSGLAAVSFALQDDRAMEGAFFAKMSTASSNEREKGHTGAFFNYLWAPLGAAVGGEDAAAAHFSRISWYLDLARRWDGGFDYDCLNGEGPNSGSQYNSFRMSTAALLTYALPLRKLHLTGRGHDPARWLTSTDVAEALTADDFDADSRSTSELVSDLGSWSPKVQRRAAEELGTRSIDTGTLDQITTLATDPAGSSRVGACMALGEINDSSTATARAATLAGLLTDPENHVRFMAAEAMRYLPTSAKQGELDTILAAAASTSQALTPYDEEDPLHFAHARLAMLLFYSGNAYGPKGLIWEANDLVGVDRNLLYPAIRAVAANPVGQARGTLSATYRNLNLTDVEQVADAIVESVRVRAPADKMFSGSVRQAGIDTLEKHGFAEGVPLSMIYMVNDERGSAYTGALEVLQDYAGSCTTVDPDPDVIGFCESLLAGSQAEAAQAVLDAIAADPTPTPLTPFKSIQSVSPDSPTLTLPATSTVLRTTAGDLAQGDSVFTWRKIHGAGHVSFTPNGSAAAADTTIQFDPVPGHYLFEVTMSDSRGLTEIYQTVSVTLYDSSGTLPPNDPPTADPQSLTLTQSTPNPISLSGSDPEDYPLIYAVTSQPAHGSLSGTAPYLLYTPEHPYTGPDSFSFEVMDSEGQVSSATIDLTISAATAFELAAYEPFDYPAGGLGGASGSSEVGLDGTWSASSSATVVSDSLSHGTLPTAGNSIGGLNGGSNNFGGARTVSAAALAGNGLLDDGAVLWFSAIMGYDADGNRTNSRLVMVLADESMNSGNYNYWFGTPGATGLGVTVGRFGSNGRIVATQVRDSTFGDGFAGNVFGSGQDIAVLPSDDTNVDAVLVVGRITWAGNPADPDLIELFLPGTDLALPDLSSPHSSLSVTIDQSGYDTITWSRGDKVVLDEIRFGATYYSVLFGSVAMTPDLAAPVPDPMDFATPPTALGTSSITMVAAPAYDPTGVEYHFACTAGGGNDSDWQESPSYTDTGLTPGTAYTYRVRARDKSPAQNLSDWSATASASTSALTPTDYDNWSASYPGADLSDPDADLDGDSLSNNEERVWGLDPTTSSPLLPFTGPFDPAGNSFSYTRRDPALSGLSYSVWASPNLQPGSWTEDSGATQARDSLVDDVETVVVTLTATPINGRLFARIRATEP